MEKTVLMKGNEAIAEAAIRAGCKVYFGYPITPQNEIPEYMAANLGKAGGTFVQTESELASISMLYGAGGTGERAMTSSSSIGIALMQEGISFMAGAQVPGVIVNMNRGGPGLGGIQASQGDYFQATKGGGNGDYYTLCLAPESIQEACDLVQLLFDLAQKYRQPVMMLGDGMIGQMMEPVCIKEPEQKEYDLSWATRGWDGVSRERAIINSHYPNPDDMVIQNGILQEKYRQMEAEEVRYEEYMCEDAETIMVAWGTVARICKSAIKSLRNQGVKAGLIRPISLYPFPYAILEEYAKKDQVKRFLTVEMCAGQMVEDVIIGTKSLKPIERLNKLGMMSHTPKEIADYVIELEAAEKEGK